jgi:hypothetical protein
MYFIRFVGIIKDVITVRKTHGMERFKIIYAVIAGVTKLLVNLGVFNVKQIADALEKCRPVSTLYFC